MKNIVLIDTAFPFEKVESFIETEIKYYKKKQNIYIAPCMVKDKSNKRDINKYNAKVLEISKVKNNKLYRRILKIFDVFPVIFNKLIYKEIIYLYKAKKLKMCTLKELILFLSQGDKLVKQIKLQIIDEKVNEKEIIFYSYWMHIHAYVAVKLKKEFEGSVAITRCHRYDLYENETLNNYIPMRKYIIENLDEIFTISQDGKNYINDNYFNINKNVSVSRLGTLDYGIGKIGKRNILKIVSCSWLVPVKRVDMIVNSLAMIDNIQIEWTHFGDGPLFNEINTKAKCLPNNIKYTLKGAVSNSEILNYYKNNEIDVFINVSRSEGIPVSIMEVQSFGIPIIATNVGGMSELVFNKKNGYILDKDFSEEDLIKAIRYFKNISDEEYLKYRKNSRKLWENTYSAETNYSEFINYINRP